MRNGVGTKTPLSERGVTSDGRGLSTGETASDRLEGRQSFGRVLQQMQRENGSPQLKLAGYRMVRSGVLHAVKSSWILD